MSSGGSGGPDNLTTTVTSQYPDYALGPAKDFLNAAMNYYLPGGNFGPSPSPYNEVAPLTNAQLQAMQAVQGFGTSSPLTQGAQQYVGSQLANRGGQEQLNATIRGDYLSPDTNPYLRQYFNAAADPLITQYQFATSPDILAKGANSGTLVSSGATQANQLARYNLGRNLASLAAQTYEPAYQQERSNQQNATGTRIAQQQNLAAQVPGLVNAQYTPSQQLMNVGNMQQQQAQNVLTQGYQNLNAMGLWPQQALAGLGAAFGPATGSQGTQTTVSPNLLQTVGAGSAGGIGAGALGGLLGGLFGGGSGGSGKGK